MACRISIATIPGCFALQGNKRQRLGEEEYMAVVEEFCMAIKDKWPHALVQFEDFQTDHAFAILERMRSRLLCFNDDIQVRILIVLP